MKRGIMTRLLIAAAFVAAAFLLSRCAHDPGPRTIAELSCGAAAEAVLHAASITGCPKIRVERTHAVVRSNGRMWLVAKLNVCGEKLVYEKRRGKWRDVTWRLR